MNFVPVTADDRKSMLERIGVPSFDALLAGIPRSIPRADLKIPSGLSEPELLSLAIRQAAQNVTTRSHLCFLGAGAYDHFIPAAVRYITSRGEFLTAYTPYQPEASQGTLQAMYEFQSLLCDVTGMEVANASLYEGASALAEGTLVALRETQRQKLLIAQSVHPEYRQTLATYLKQSQVKMGTISLQDGVSDLASAREQMDSQVAAVVVQMPNAFGCLEPVEALGELAHQQGALFIVVVNPISLGILKAPASYGADIVVGEGQPLGTDLQYGGPYLGLFACRKSLLRKVPGRIVGMTRDTHGRRGFVLTLQTREQHIRRAKATSNICTNEAMMALAAAVYLGCLGKEGFREVATQNLLKAHYGYNQLLKLPRVRPLFQSPFFNEFALEMPKDPELINQQLLTDGFLGGFPLRQWDPRLSKGWLICITEARSKEEIDRFVASVRKAIQ